MKFKVIVSTITVAVLLFTVIVFTTTTIAQPPPGRPRGGPPRGVRGKPVELGPDPLANVKMGPNLITRGKLMVARDAKLPFVLEGDATQGLLGDSRLEHNGGGIRFYSAEDRNKDGVVSGEATCTIAGVNAEEGRWYRVSVSGLGQDDFAVDKGDLYLKVEFFKDGGANSLDFIKKSIVDQLNFEREALYSPATTNKNVGQAIWQNFSIKVRTPFAEVDTLKLSVGFEKGNGTGDESEFWVREVEVSPIPNPVDYAPPPNSSKSRKPPALKTLVKLGGRWFYDSRGGDKTPPKQFDHSNVDRLYYLTDRLETPFVNNVSAWLRPNYVDLAGKKVEKERLVEDSVVISFTEKHLVMNAKNLPNHPVAVFPDRTRFIDGNPGVIKEKANTWYLPLEPKENPDRGKAISMENKRALPMGPIGVAVNGVVFYNPFDGPGFDATAIMDRCCGHTGPTSDYHYHKYPVCLNTPWADEGTGHSPLIGFAFDGYPVFGPYESKGVLAKDLKENPLNDFSVHTDEFRGPHYHVTPGKFPHMIGGYWGVVETKNRSRR